MLCFLNSHGILLYCSLVVFLGTYLYFNASAYPNREGALAWVTSNEYTREKTDEPRCLRFWYYFGGRDYGKLRVRLMQGSDSGEIWSEGGWNWWNLAMVSIGTNLPQLAFRLRFESQLTSATPNGGIAIDEISMTEVECKPVGE